MLINQIPNAVGITHEWIENILYHELGVSKCSTRWVPLVFTLDQMHTSLVISQGNLAVFEANPAGFLTQDKLTTLNQRPNGCSCSGNTRCLPYKEGQYGVIGRKSDSLCLLVWKGIVLIAYIQKGHIINECCDGNLLRQIQRAITLTWPGKLTKGVLLDQDNTPA